MILDKIKEMGDNLKMLERQDRLQYLVDKARQVDPLPESAKIESNRIHGCASKLWIIGGEREDGTMIYQVDGDAYITRGTAKVVTDIVMARNVLMLQNLRLKVSCLLESKNFLQCNVRMV